MQLSDKQQPGTHKHLVWEALINHGILLHGTVVLSGFMRPELSWCLADLPNQYWLPRVAEKEGRSHARQVCSCVHWFITLVVVCACSTSQQGQTHIFPHILCLVSCFLVLWLQLNLRSTWVEYRNGVEPQHLHTLDLPAVCCGQSGKVHKTRCFLRSKSAKYSGEQYWTSVRHEFFETEPILASPMSYQHNAPDCNW